MKKTAIYAMAAGLCLSSAAAKEWNACRSVEAYPGRDWRLQDASQFGWDESALTDAKTLFERLESSSVMVVYKGRLIAEWGDAAEPLTAQSVRKGLLSSLIGVLVDDRKLSLDDTLADLGVDDSEPPLTDAEKQAALRDLLHSRSGIFHSALYEVGGWKRQRMALQDEKISGEGRAFAPGDYWIYNNWDFNALGTIVESASGKSIGEFFQRKIAQPLHMQDFAPSNIEYTTRDDQTEQHFGNVSDHRAYVFNISTRDLARYGLMYLGCGKWNDAHILSKTWVLESLNGIDTRQGRNAGDPPTGFGDYGFLWQIDRPGARRYAGMKTREPVYFATGNRGHILAVFPYLDLVIAHQVGTRGGVRAEAQIKRARDGSPTVGHDDMTALMKAIIAAHPDAASAYEGE